MLHRRRPGRLLARAAQDVEACLPPRSSAARVAAPLAPRWIEYLRTVKPFGTNQRLNAESLTIAASLDLLIRGEFLRVGDVLAQRYKALELSA